MTISSTSCGLPSSSCPDEPLHQPPPLLQPPPPSGPLHLPPTYNSPLMARQPYSAPTVQLIFSSRVNKSKAENFRGQILQAFESVLHSAIILEIRYESKNGARAGHDPSVFTFPENDSSNMTLRRSITKHSPLSSGGENLIRRLKKDRIVKGASSSKTRWMQSDPHILTEGEIIEVGPSHVRRHAETNNGVLDINERRKDNVWEEALSSPNQESMVNQGGGNGNKQRRQNSIVKGKVSLAHVIGKAEACSQRGGWSRRKAMSIAEKLEQENLRLEPRSRSILCWRTSKTRRKLSSFRVRTPRSRAVSRFILCGRCISTKSPR